MGVVEYEDYGLNKLCDLSRDENGNFSQKLFIEKGMNSVSPLTQFKVLYNMPLCFISIENNLKGENAVSYSNAQALLLNALFANQHPVIIGAGKVNSDGSIESGFAYVTKDDILQNPYLESAIDAIAIFKKYKAGLNE